MGWCVYVENKVAADLFPVQIYENLLCLVDEVHDGFIPYFVADLISPFYLLKYTFLFEYGEMLGCIRLVEVEFFTDIVYAEVFIINCFQYA